MRMILALAFVQQHRVVEAFEQLSDQVQFPAEAEPVIDYFEDTFIGRPNRNNQRRRPLFSVDMWNVYSAVEDGLPKTNNALEGWH